MYIYFFLLFLFQNLALAHDLPLKREWLGLVKDTNLRDVGQSINECLGEKMFKEGMLLRSNRYFSGWSCENIGNPDAILSLNYSPKENQSYYCTRGEEKIIGKIFNTTFQLNDIENLEQWREKDFNKTLCQDFEFVFTSFANAKRLLVHCDAGRDRTGALSAMLAALALEEKKALDDRAISAIECDYRKSKTLKKEKYGRMEQLVRELRNRGGVKKFLKDQCGFEEILITSAIRNFL